MKLHKSSNFLLVSAIIHQVTCDDYKELAKLIQKNSKSIKSLKNNNKKLIKENKDLKKRVEELDSFVTGQQSDFITSVDKKVEQLLAYWNLDIENSQIDGNSLLLSIRNWLTSHSDSFTNFWTWRDDVDNDIEKFNQQQNDFIGDLRVTNANIQSQQAVIDDFNIDVHDLKNKYVVLQDRMDVDNKNVNNQILEMTTKDNEFKNDIQGLEYDVEGLRNKQNSTSESVLKNYNQIIDMTKKDETFEIQIKNLVDDVSDLNNAPTRSPSQITTNEDEANTQVSECIQNRIPTYSKIIDDAVFDKNRESNLLSVFKICYKWIQSF